jgi:hypothetical protein
MRSVRRRVDAWLAARGEAARRRLDPKFVHPVYLEHPPTADPSPRFGHGRPGQAAIEAWLATRRPEYAALLTRLAAHGPAVTALPVAADPCAPEPGLVQEWLPGGDILVLYGLVRDLAPPRYVEIGSGTSTKVVARARQDGGLATRITSIDPAPRAEVDAVCDDVIRQPLEAVDPALFEDLRAGDVLFMDGSHVAFMGSDVVAFVFDVLPRLAPGVLVGIHDMFWPDDYPAEWATYSFNEQYVIGALLLGPPSWLEPVLPVRYALGDPELGALVAPVWDRPGLEAVERLGSTLWLRTLAPLRPEAAISPPGGAPG